MVASTVSFAFAHFSKVTNFLCNFAARVFFVSLIFIFSGHQVSCRVPAALGSFSGGLLKVQLVAVTVAVALLLETGRAL